MADSRNFLLQHRMLGACSDAYRTRPLAREKTTTKESYKQAERCTHPEKHAHKQAKSQTHTKAINTHTLTHPLRSEAK